MKPATPDPLDIALEQLERNCVDAQGAAALKMLTAAPDLLVARQSLQVQLNAYQEFAESWFTSGLPEDWKGRSICANSAHEEARAAIVKAVQP